LNTLFKAGLPGLDSLGRTRKNGVLHELQMIKHGNLKKNFDFFLFHFDFFLFRKPVYCLHLTRNRLQKTPPKTL